MAQSASKRFPQFPEESNVNSKQSLIAVTSMGGGSGCGEETGLRPVAGSMGV